MFKTKYLLIVILLVAAIFRFVGITKAPPGLNWDEVSIGYNAYSILKTGKDEWGVFMPLAFKAFGEVKLPGMIYASVPGIALFGPTDFGVRFTPAMIGILGVFVIYLLAYELFGKKSYGLAASTLLAISPWGVHFSRVSFEAGLAMVLTMLSLYFLLKAREQVKYYYHAMAFAVLSLYTYNSVRILLPLLLIAYLILKVIKLKKENYKTLIVATVIGILLAIPNIQNLMSKEGRIRLGTVSITSQKGFYDAVGESRGYLLSLPGALPRLIQNKFTHYVFTFADNYVQTFSSEFLFFKGSLNTQRSVQGMGLLYIFELPLLIVGLSQLISKDKKYHAALVMLLPWLLLAPIPSAITTDAPSSVRALGMLPALLLIESLGLITLINYFKSRPRIYLVPISLFIVWNISYFSYLMWFVNPVKYASDWLSGYKEMVEFVKKNGDDADHIYITAEYGEPYIYTLFYTAYDPHTYQTQGVSRSPDPTGWIHVSGFGKYIFTEFSALDSPKEIVARKAGKIIMVDGFATIPGEYKRDLTIKAKNGIILFEGTIQQGKGQE